MNGDGKPPLGFFIPLGWKYCRILKYDPDGSERLCHVFTNEELNIRRSFFTSSKIQYKTDAFIAFDKWYDDIYMRKV